MYNKIFLELLFYTGPSLSCIPSKRIWIHALSKKYCRKNLKAESLWQNNILYSYVYDNFCLMKTYGIWYTIAPPPSPTWCPLSVVIVPGSPSWPLPSFSILHLYPFYCSWDFNWVCFYKDTLTVPKVKSQSFTVLISRICPLRIFFKNEQQEPNSSNDIAVEQWFVPI